MADDLLQFAFDNEEQSTDSIVKQIEETRNPATGDDLPMWANGADENRPINRSPLKPDERLKLAFGNEKGNDDWLKANFEDAKKSSVTGVTSVKKDGLWYAVDPKEGGDAWSLTDKLMGGAKGLAIAGSALLPGGQLPAFSASRAAASSDTVVDQVASEVISDIADIAPEALAITGTIGAGLATGGASLAVQAGSLAAAGGGISALKSSMGKLEGTYAGSWEDVAGEAGFEALLNVGGVVIPAGGAKALRSKGAQSAGRWITSQLKKAKPGWAKMPEAAKDIMASVAGASTKAGDAAVHNLMNHTDEIGGILDDATRGATDDIAKNKLLERGSDQIMKVANQANKALSDLYERNLDEIANLVPESVQIHPGASFSNILDDWSTKGIVSKANGQFHLVNPKSVRDLAAAGDPLAATISRNYGVFKKVFTEINNQTIGKFSAGPKALKEVVQKQKLAQRLVESEIKQAMRKGNQELTDGFLFAVKDQIKGNLDGVLQTTLNKAGTLPNGVKLSDLWGQKKAAWSTAKKTLNPYVKLARTHIDQQIPASQRLFSQIGSERTSIALQKANRDGFKLLEGVNKNLPKMAQELEFIDAAYKFVPKVRGSFIQFGVLGAGGATASAAVQGEPEQALVGLGALGAITAFTSPRLLATALRTPGAKQIFAKGMTNARKFMLLNKLSDVQRPEVLKALYTGVLNSASTRSEVEEALAKAGQGGQ